MYSRKLLKAVVVIAALFAGATALRAQSIDVFAMGTASSLFDKGYFTEYSTPYGSTYKTGGGITVGAEVKMSRVFGIEGAYSNLRNNLTITNYGGSIGLENGYGIRNQRFSGDMLLHVPKPIFGLKPYAAAGLEYDRFAQAGPSSNFFGGFTNATFGASNKIGANYGVGVDMKLLPHLSLRVDVRDHIMSTPTYGFPKSSTVAAYYPLNVAAHDLDYSAGLVFRFGK
jgi:opacity protein-like surface antigen